jgi:hypothetical protein
MGQTLHNTWVGVLLCTAMAMVLTIGCLPKGTCYRLCPVLVSIPVVALAGAEAAEVVTAIATTLALRVPALAGGGPVLLAAALLAGGGPENCRVFLVNPKMDGMEAQPYSDRFPRYHIPFSYRLQYLPNNMKMTEKYEKTEPVFSIILPTVFTLTA